MSNFLYAFLDFLGLSMYWEELDAEDINFESLGLFSQSELESFSIPALEVIRDGESLTEVPGPDSA